MNDTFAVMAKTWDRTAFDSMLSAAKETGHKKYDVAEKLGIPASTLSDWVKGKHAPLPVYQKLFEGVEKEMRRKPKKKGGTA